MSFIACRRASYRPFEHLAVAHLASLGVGWLELPLPADAADADRQRGALDRHGLRASALQGRCDLASQDLPRQIAEQLPLMAAFGCPRMLVSLKAGNLPREHAYQQLRAAGDVAAAHGVTLMIETHPDLATNGRVALETMRRVDHPAVRLNYDPANIRYHNEGLDEVRELVPVAGYVAGVHLKDTPGGYHEWNFPALGEGIIDFAGLFAMLDRVGYAGPYTLEIEGVAGEERTEAVVLDRIEASVRTLRRLGRMP